MTDIETLLAIEAIKQLKARYFRALDTNDWDLFASTLTNECIGDYSDGDLAFKNRDEIVSFMRNNLSGKKMLTLHQGHTPEITLLDKNNASGIWYLEDTVLALEANMRIYGAAIYTDEYRKEHNEWRINTTSYKRTFECAEPLPQGHTVKKNGFA
jgi:hypothetical protein